MVDVCDPVFSLENRRPGFGIVCERYHMWRKLSSIWDAAYYKDNVGAR